MFTAVALLGVPYTPRNGMRPTDAFAMAGGDEEFYVSYFQEPGRAEREIDPDVRGWLRGLRHRPRTPSRSRPAAQLADRFADAPAAALAATSTPTRPSSSARGSPAR